MKLLVTGGCGFIGSNFIRLILKDYPDDEIINLDKLTYAGNPENLVDIEVDPRYRFVLGDICDQDLVGKLLSEGPDAVLNFAAESHVDRSIEDPRVFVRTDVLGTFTLLEAAREAGVQRFLQVSTDEIYGSIKQGSFTENSPLAPSSPYSASKAGADLLTHSYYVTFGMPTLITRSSNNFGPYQYPEKIIPLFITNLVEGKKVPLYGDGRNVRDWLYVADNCRAIDLVLRSGEPGQAYNIGGDREMTNLELTHMMLRVMSESEEMIENVEDRLGHDLRYSIDSSKVKELGWKPERDFESELKDTIDWYRENTSWWKKLKGDG